MKKIISTDGMVTKYLHDNGTETSFKKQLSGQYDSSLDYPDFKNKQKYSLVLSCSHGCQLSCSFCHLTQNNKQFKKISAGDVILNIKSVIEDQIKEDPSLKNRYIKLCWMGEGEPLLNYEMIRYVTEEILYWVLENQYAEGLDGVDISTSMPKVKKEIINDLNDFNKYLYIFNKNPNNKEKTPLRLFYSLHSVNDEIRSEMMPKTIKINDAVLNMKHVSDAFGIDTIFHYTWINGKNDSNEDVDKLIQFWIDNNLTKSQLRILRYNGGLNRDEESMNLNKIILKLKKAIPNLKVQHSAGKDVKSSCGMFN